MSTPSISAWRPRPLLVAAIVFVLAFDVAFMWQRHTGAYGSEFGGHPDEAGHYVTGLMIRDYVAAGFPGPPMTFANEYYRHYPKVALGVWPPFFYVVQTAWTLPFGVGRASMMLLMAALAAVLATQLYGVLRDEFGAPSAGCAALVLLCLPLFREYYAMVMAETLSAVLMFGAAWKFGRYLDDERPADALWFGLCAALAILTKGTGLALAIVAPLALALVGKWPLLKRPALWASAALVAVLAGPWTFWFRNEGRLKGGWLEPNPSWHFTGQAIPYYAGKLGLALGFVLVLLMAIGLFVQMLRPRQRRGVWAAMAALLAGVFVFQCILPVGLEDRHLIPALPAALMFAVAGFHAVIRWWESRSRSIEIGTPASSANFIIGLLVTLVFAMVFSVALFNPHPPKRWIGFGSIAATILEDTATARGTVLVSSDGRGEGMFISELAMRETRPGHVVKRANKELASMKWSGADMRSRFDSEDDLLAYFAKSDIDYIVVDDSMPDNKRGAHHDQLRRAAEEHTDVFWPVASTPVIRAGGSYPTPLRAYRVKHKN